MQVLPQCGHAVHEDAPEKVSDVNLSIHCVFSIDLLFDCVDIFLTSCPLSPVVR